MKNIKKYVSLILILLNNSIILSNSKAKARATVRLNVLHNQLITKQIARRLLANSVVGVSSPNTERLKVILATQAIKVNEKNINSNIGIVAAPINNFNNSKPHINFATVTEPQSVINTTFSDCKPAYYHPTSVPIPRDIAIYDPSLAYRLEDPRYGKIVSTYDGFDVFPPTDSLSSGDSNSANEHIVNYYLKEKIKIDHGFSVNAHELSSSQINVVLKMYDQYKYKDFQDLVIRLLNYPEHKEAAYYCLKNILDKIQKNQIFAEKFGNSLFPKSWISSQQPNFKICDFICPLIENYELQKRNEEFELSTVNNTIQEYKNDFEAYKVKQDLEQSNFVQQSLAQDCKEYLEQASDQETKEIYKNRIILLSDPQSIDTNHTISKNYAVNPIVQNFLSKLNLNSKILQNCNGTALAQSIHAQSLHIINNAVRTANSSNNQLVQSFSNLSITHAHKAIVENQNNQPLLAQKFLDVADSFLSIAQAFINGAIKEADFALNNPLSTAWNLATRSIKANIELLNMYAQAYGAAPDHMALEEGSLNSWQEQHKISDDFSNKTIEQIGQIYDAIRKSKSQENAETLGGLVFNAFLGSKVRQINLNQLLGEYGKQTSKIITLSAQKGTDKVSRGLKAIDRHKPIIGKERTISGAVKSAIEKLEQYDCAVQKMIKNFDKAKFLNPKESLFPLVVVKDAQDLTKAVLTPAGKYLDHAGNLLDKVPVGFKLVKMQDNTKNALGWLTSKTNSITPLTEISDIKAAIIKNSDLLTQSTRAALSKLIGENKALHTFNKNIQLQSPSKLIPANVPAKIVLLGTGLPNVIKKFNTKLLFDKYKEHIFSEDHVKKGILNLGNSKEEIFEKFYKIIKEADINSLIKEGTTQIRTTINGHRTELRVFVKNGETLSVNCFLKKNAIYPRNINVVYFDLKELI